MRGALKTVQLELLNVCNLRCPICRIAAREPEAPVFLDLETLRRLIDALGEMPDLFILYGRIGEPLLHPRIAEIVRYLHGAGPTRTRISTNGMLMQGALMEELVDTPLSTMVFALDGASPQTYSRYRRGGDFRQVCRNIRATNRRRRKVGNRTLSLVAQFIPMRHNEHELAAFIRLAERLGCDEARVKISGSVSRDPEFRPTHPEFVVPDEASRSAADACDMRIVYVDCRGNVYPCCYAAGRAAEVDPGFLRLGSLRDSTWDEIRSGEAYRALLGAFESGRLPDLCGDKCTYMTNKVVHRIKLGKETVPPYDPVT